MKFIFTILIVAALSSCSNNGIGVEGLNQTESVNSPEEKLDYGSLPFKNENGNLTAVIEIPAGTSHKFEYNYSSKEFECEIINGKQRVVKYLPYVGSYGFIPGTFMDTARGGDGDALDILIIGESIAQGKVLEIKPIATLKLLDGGEEDHKIIGIPLDDNLNHSKITDYESMPESIKLIIKTWFTNYKGPGEMEFQKWVGTQQTIDEIVKWKKNDY